MVGPPGVAPTVRNVHVRARRAGRTTRQSGRTRVRPKGLRPHIVRSGTAGRGSGREAAAQLKQRPTTFFSSFFAFLRSVSCEVTLVARAYNVRLLNNFV